MMQKFFKTPLSKKIRGDALLVHYIAVVMHYEVLVLIVS